MPKKILCAVDGSDAAEHAAVCAADLAKETEAKLAFVSVHTVPTGRFEKPHFWDETLLATADAQIHTQLAHAVKAANTHGVTAFDTVIVTANKVSSAIIAYADEKGFDHIVMGTGVTNELERLILGSVATDVVSHAHCPVTIVRGKHSLAL